MGFGEMESGNLGRKVRIQFAPRESVLGVSIGSFFHSRVFSFLLTRRIFRAKFDYQPFRDFHGRTKSVLEKDGCFEGVC